MADFGDRVRIRESPETLAAGLAGMEGDVYGVTTPSVTNIEPIGGVKDDCALNVSIEGKGGFWLRPDLVELLHHNPGMEMVVGNNRAVRRPDGSWSETTIKQSWWQRLWRRLNH